MSTETEYNVPLEIDPRNKTFRIIGMLRDQESEDINIDSMLIDTSPNNGLVLRITPTEPNKFVLVNRLIWVGNKSRFQDIITYNQQLFSPETNPYRHNLLSIEQLASLARIFQEISQSYGSTTNIDETTLYSDERVKDILEAS